MFAVSLTLFSYDHETVLLSCETPTMASQPRKSDLVAAVLKKHRFKESRCRAQGLRKTYASRLLGNNVDSWS